MKINKETRLILSISDSPGNFGTTFHNYLYQKFDQNYLYKACLCKDIVISVKSIKALSLFGMSVSMPFKKKAIHLVDELSEEAIKFKSLNTIVNNNGKLVGYNTDVYALEKILEIYKIKANTILIIGSGAIAEMCNIFFLGKTVHLKARNGAQKDYLDEIYKNDNNYLKEYDLVINTTPKKIKELEDDLSQLRNYKFIIDYPVRSEYIVENEDRYISGFELTKHQAKKQYELYTGLELNSSDLDEVINICKKV